MKSILDMLKLTRAIGYNGEPIKLGNTYYSVGNTIWQYRITNIINEHMVEYELIKSFKNDKWNAYQDDQVRRARACFFVSRNIYLQQYGK